MNTTLETPQAGSPSKSWLPMALIYGLNFGLFLSVLTRSLAVGFSIGLAVGCLFAAFMSEFVRSQTCKFAASQPDFGAETIVHTGPANHFKRLDSVGGHLWLTSGQLRFRSHKLNLQNHEWTVSLADVASAQTAKTLGIIPNGLRIRLASGEEHRFVVNDPDHWVQAITQARQDQTSA
ncbi:hypothetical protein [Prosthecobacter sp.]|uniref:hypothetical protein n=1 Tax=Prosthecobacter sp. TaxID=1965333 RepID=UPI0037836020